MPDKWIPETRGRLAQRRARKPDTKSGQLWALWPEIKAALDDGQSVRTVLDWLKEDAGIVVSIGSLTSYISRIRKREAAERTAEAAKASSVRIRSPTRPFLSERADSTSRGADGAVNEGTDPTEKRSRGANDAISTEAPL